MNLTFALPPMSPRALQLTPRITKHRRASVSKPTCSLQDDLRTRLSALIDTKYQKWHSNYLRHQVPVLGVRMPAIRKTVHAWAKDHDLGSNPEAKQIALRLFDREYEEEKLAGVLVLNEVLQPLHLISTADLKQFARVFDNGGIAYWNSCDWFCVKVLAQLVRDEGKSAMDGIAEWRSADNLWKARASIVGLLSTVDEKEGRELLLECCSVVIKREERWAKSAVGWALRETAKVDKGCAVKFLGEYLRWVNLECVRNATRTFADGEKKRWAKQVKENGAT